MLQTIAADASGQSQQEQPTPTNNSSVTLPREILLQIVSDIPFLGSFQKDLASFCLVSRDFYLAGIEKLYFTPRISSKNFDTFVRTICPSINLRVRRSGFGSLIRVLDMSRLVHDGSKSLTARLLGRVRENVSSFVAPAATFSIGCFAALAKCQKLKVLDLSFVIERIDITQLFKSIGKLPELAQLHIRAVEFPSKDVMERDTHQWPPKLEWIEFEGHLCHDAGAFLAHKMPAQGCKLKYLVISNFCDRCYSFLKMDFAKNLRFLSCSMIPDDRYEEINSLLLDLPHLTELAINYPNLRSKFFTLARPISPPHPLEVLTLTADGDQDVEEWLWSPRDILLAIEAGGLSNLRQIHLNEEVADFCFAMAEDRGEDYVKYLTEAMVKHEDQKAKSEGEGYQRKEVGVWNFEM